MRGKAEQLSLANAQVYAALGEGRSVALRQGQMKSCAPTAWAAATTSASLAACRRSGCSLDSPETGRLLEHHAHLAHQRLASHIRIQNHRS